MGFLDILKRKLKEQKDEDIERYNKNIDEYNVQVDRENMEIGRDVQPKLDLSKKIGLNFSKLNLDKKDVRDKTLFLLDVSGSMADEVDGKPKIEHLRDVMSKFTDARMLCFSSFIYPISNASEIPKPDGTTNLLDALKHIRDTENLPERIVLVSDGEPDSESYAEKEATKLGLPIDIIFIGDKGSNGEKFMEELAKLTGGKHFVV